jgi:hypothetical protein
MTWRDAPPRADAMIESLRGLGYTSATALADIIDNSITAGAERIDVGLEWAGSDSRIWILDNGQGMSDPQLEAAMRLGDKSPLDKRDASDLGRFGMGLKTASFSQCRRLTVASRRDGSLSCLRWDLDELLRTPDRWRMFEGPHPGSQQYLGPLSRLQSGTLVLWEGLDRIVTQGYKADDFADLADDIDRHLAMVFHRLIEMPKPAFRLFINGRPVTAWDPFLVGHMGKTWAGHSARQHTSAGLVEVEGHVLPHRDMMSTKEWDGAAGPRGWAAQQGFYVYRNKRLLLAGGWLGLGHGGRAWNREEPFRLARLRLDIPNTADAEWKIDIRKSTARPPVALRSWLIRIAEDTRDRARRVFAFRGAPVMGPGKSPVAAAWRAESTKAGMRYRIDVSHPAVASVLESNVQAHELVKAMLRVIEETVPVQRIWLDTAERKETPQTGFAGEPNETVIEVARVFFEDLVTRKGLSVEDARKSLLRTEPFQKFPALVARLGSNT